MSANNKVPAEASLSVSQTTLALVQFDTEDNAGSDTNDNGIESDHSLGNSTHAHQALHCDIAQQLESLADGWEACCDCILLDIDARGDERHPPGLQPQTL
jgi:hypothetical protein